jgi:Fe-S cluster assembly protein SufB
LIRSKYQIYCQKYVFSTANTYPNISCGNDSSAVEHEASTGKISEQVLFFLMSRGLSQEDAISLVVSGFCSEVLTNLPFEFAVEAKKLLQVSMEGSVG